MKSRSLGIAVMVLGAALSIYFAKYYDIYDVPESAYSSITFSDEYGSLRTYHFVTNDTIDARIFRGTIRKVGRATGGVLFIIGILQLLWSFGKSNDEQPRDDFAQRPIPENEQIMPPERNDAVDVVNGTDGLEQQPDK